MNLFPPNFVGKVPLLSILVAILIDVPFISSILPQNEEITPDA